MQMDQTLLMYLLPILSHIGIVFVLYSFLLEKRGNIVLYYLCFHKKSLSEYQSKQPLVSHTGQAVVAHTFNPSKHTS